MKIFVGASLLATALGFFISSKVARTIAKEAPAQCQGQQLEMKGDKSQDFSLAKTVPGPSDLFRMFSDFDLLSPPSTFTKVGSFMLATDVKETEKAFEITCDVPGVEKKNIHVKIDGDELQISADRSYEKKEKGDHFHRIERQSGHVYRAFTLPDYAEKDHVTSEYVDGVLKVHVPKNVERAKKRDEVRMIEIK